MIFLKSNLMLECMRNFSLKYDFVYFKIVKIKQQERWET